MREELLPDGRKRLVYDYRGAKGPRRVSQILPAKSRIAAIVKAKAQLVLRAERRSLKYNVRCKFEDVVALVVNQNNAAGMPWIYDRIRRELAGHIDVAWVQRYNRYIDALQDEEKSRNTIANHKSCIKRVLNTAYKRRMIDDMPVRDWDIRREFRSRVLSPEERQRLENVMLQCKSHLYWSIRLMESRPIRKRDCWALTRENLVLFGDGAPYIRFRARKTGLETVLPLADLPDIDDYLKCGIPPACPFLFPRSFGNGEWTPMGNAKRHFGWLLHKAGIADFHMHDFKRMATTAMLDSGYTAEDLLDLGIYAGREMIDRCYKRRNAMEVLFKKFSMASTREAVVLLSPLKAVSEEK